MIEGAFFIDAGNIWAINTTDKREGALFNAATFWNEIAIGTGYGFRLDFDFFIIRFDFGLRLREPYSENGKHWIPGNRRWNNNDWAFSVGIGYPF
jgi:outer membrane protein assembly factor BamA